MQSLLGVDLFGTHGDDMKQISDKKEHQTQARIRGEYENREGPWRGDTTSRAVAPSFFSTRTSPAGFGGGRRGARPRRAWAGGTRSGRGGSSSCNMDLS